jgi:rhamnose transport system substrate-binding protein
MMKTALRTFRGLALFAALALLIVACGGGDGGGEAAGGGDGGGGETAAAGAGGTEGGEAGGGGGGGEGPTVAFVPKLVGIPYFDAMDQGGQRAAEELGLNWIYQGPNTADSAAQIEIINSLIQRGVDAIAIAPNDPSAIGPVIDRAMSQGIDVFTTDTDAPETQREIFVAQASNEAIATATIDALAEQMGESGQWAIVSCGPSAQNLNTWIEIERQVAEEKYPEMEFLTVEYAGENQEQATTIARDLITANPDLKGLIGQCTTSAPGVGQAIQETGNAGEIAATGVATPTAMEPYITSGAMPQVVLWNPIDLGYLTAWAGQELAAAEGTTADGVFSDSIDVPGLEGASWLPDQQNTLLLGEPLVFTQENIDQYAGQF